MPDHRIERAFERYGLVLSQADLDELERQCSKATCMRVNNDSEVHILRWQGQTVVVAAKAFGAGRRIATFLPPDFFSSQRRKDYFPERFGKAGRPKGPYREKLLMRRRERQRLMAAE